jgi:hypothetical protein
MTTKVSNSEIGVGERICERGAPKMRRGVRNVRACLILSNR